MTRRAVVFVLLVVAALFGCADAARRTAAPRGAAKTTDPCATITCANSGKCQVTGRARVASCKCKPGTSGQFCEQVAPGRFFDAAAGKVKPCPVNNYCSGGPGAPVTCPVGSMTQGAMKKTVADCRLREGYYCPSYDAAGVCTPGPCPAGSYCPGKPSITDATNNGLIACPACTGPECVATSPPMSTDVVQCDCLCPSCTDLVKNGGESDVDCGGAATGCPRCIDGQTCALDGDCVEGSVCPASSICAKECTTNDDCAGSSTTLTCTDSVCVA